MPGAEKFPGGGSRWRRIEVVKSDGLFLWIFDVEGS